jgi:hypothetical protein
MIGAASGIFFGGAIYYALSHSASEDTRIFQLRLKSIQHRLRTFQDASGEEKRVSVVPSSSQFGDFKSSINQQWRHAKVQWNELVYATVNKLTSNE